MRRLRLSLVFASATLCASCGESGEERPAKAGPAAESPPAGWFFVNVAATAGLVEPIRSGTEKQEYIAEVKGLGVALLDYDLDGKLDIFFSAGSTVERCRRNEPGFGCKLYRNETEHGGPLRFRDVTGNTGIPKGSWSAGPAVADYDDDGDPDVLVTGFGRALLLRNTGKGTFEEVSDEAGLKCEGWSTGAAFGDLDGDGDLDVYIARYLDFDVNDPPVHGKGLSCLWKARVVMCGPRGLVAEADKVFRNDGNGRFTELTGDLGFDQAKASYGLGVLISDFNKDGRNDVFVANDSCPNFLFENLGGRFEERAFEWGVAYSADGSEQAGMGVDTADVNEDGLPDIVVTNFSNESNSLYLSQEPGRYVESSTKTGIAMASYAMLGWGIGFRDLDNDGDLDLFVANGHVFPAAGEPGTETSYRQRNQIFTNDGKCRFAEASDRLGPGLAERHVARGAAFGDLDEDGDIDVVVVNLNDTPSLLRNELPPGRHFLTLKLVGPQKNKDALGALVSVKAGGRSQTREVRRNHSFQASSDVRVHFGLGSAPAVDAIEVRWPDGTAERFEPKPPDATHTLVYGQGLR